MRTYKLRHRYIYMKSYIQTISHAYIRICNKRASMYKLSRMKILLFDGVCYAIFHINFSFVEYQTLFDEVIHALSLLSLLQIFCNILENEISRETLKFVTKMEILFLRIKILFLAKEISFSHRYYATFSMKHTSSHS